MSGCNKKNVSYENPYYPYSDFYSYNDSLAFFSKDNNLAVVDDINYGLESVHSEVAKAAGSFNIDTGEITYAQNIYEKMYPASTTKIMTCYVALKYGNPDDYVTISKNAITQPKDSSVCHLSEGDVITLRDLLYGLMLASGNDAAIAIAEHISGSEEAFVALMNEEALKMGASCTNFTNCHGMPGDNHYTSVYDLYIMFQNAVQNEEFINIMQTTKYIAEFTNKNGKKVQKEWNNSNRFLNGKVETPEGFTIIGGKTGTTQAAGYCLVMLSKNESEQQIITIVLKAQGPSDLYLLTKEILQEFNN